MEVFARCTATKRRVSGDDASDDDDEAVCEGDPEGEECRSNFSSCVDGENAEHEAEEHRAGVTHEGEWALRQAQGKWKIEEEACRTDSCESETDEGNVGLLDSCTQCEESNDGEAECGEATHLPRDPIEPVQGIHGESEPEDCEETAQEGEGSGRNEKLKIKN